jgi:hypothetical protein
MAGQIWAWGSDDFVDTYGQIANAPTNGNFTAVAAGGFHGVALLADGSVVAWGDNTYGQTNVPANATNVVAVDAGYVHNVALRADGTVVAWGSSYGGKTDVPANLSHVIAISAANSHTLALKADGTVIAWGDDCCGETVVPAGITNAVAVSCAAMASLALLADGTVRAWGYNSDGLTNVPAELTNVVSISGGTDHALALLVNRTVRAWGQSYYGETNVPPDLTNVVAISAGPAISMALKADGSVVLWGIMTNQPLGLVATAIDAGEQKWCLALANTAQPKVVINVVGPASQTVAAGSQAFFSVNASGVPPLSYQWYFGTNALAGATNRWLSLQNVQASQAGSYRVVVSNSQGSATSQPLVLSVAPSLTVNMVPAILLNGAVGTSYRVDYINVVGPTNAWNTLATVTLTNAQQFYPDYSAIGQPARFYRLVQVP